MEKFNAIKILEEEQYVEDLFNRNLGKEQYMKDVYNYVETYIRPLLEKNLSKANIPTPQYFIEEMRDEVLTDNSLSDENKEIMMKESTSGAYQIHTLTEKQNIEDIDDETYEEDIEEDEMFEDEEIKELKKLGIIGSSKEDFSYMLQDDEIGFLGKDKKIKKQLANKICDYLIRTRTYELNLNKYVEEYIIPILSKYNEEKKIKFDLNSNDKEILMISNNTIELAKRIIFENTNMSIILPFIKNELDEEIINACNFLFNDDEKSKKDFSNYFIKDILDNYDKIDFKNIEKFNLLDIMENDEIQSLTDYISLIFISNIIYIITRVYFIYLYKLYFLLQINTIKYIK